LAAFLVHQLSRKGSAMPTLTIRYAVQSDRGRVRESNQDAAYAGTHLLAVADGFGDSAALPASVAAIDALKPLDAGIPDGDLLNVLRDAVRQAETAVRELTASGTTLTAMLWSGSRLALVHIGDSRAYLFRDGELFQITHDHTVVQSMIDDGRLTPEEAVSHPQRALLLKALQHNSESEPDFELRQAEAGDRYLLCSDGLHATTTPDALREVMATATEPADAVRELVGLANRRGGPDNIACVVADVAK